MLHGFRYLLQRNNLHIFKRTNIRTGLVLGTMKGHDDEYCPYLLMPNYAYFRSCARPGDLEKVVHVIVQKKSKYFPQCCIKSLIVIPVGAQISEFVCKYVKLEKKGLSFQRQRDKNSGY